MTDAEAQALAGGQLADCHTGMPGTACAEPAFRLVLDDAYRAQIEAARLRVLRGEAFAGYKIGCVSADVRRRLGTEHAVFGHLFESEIRASPARLRCDEFCCLGIEGELPMSADAGSWAQLDSERRF